MLARRLRALIGCGRNSIMVFPWLTIQVGLELTRAHLPLAEAGAARTVLTETEGVLEFRPQMGSLVEEARELHDRVAASTGSAGAWAMSLTGAELQAAAISRHPSHVPGDREPAVRLAQHGQERSGRDLSQARCLIAQPGDRVRSRGRALGKLDLPAAPKFTRKGDAPAGRSRSNGPAPMEEYKQHLSRLTVHDEAFLDGILVEGNAEANSAIDARTAALVRVAATVAVDAALASFQHAVATPLPPARRWTRSLPAWRR